MVQITVDIHVVHGNHHCLNINALLQCVMPAFISQQPRRAVIMCSVTAIFCPVSHCLLYLGILYKLISLLSKLAMHHWVTSTPSFVVIVTNWVAAFSLACGYYDIAVGHIWCPYSQTRGKSYLHLSNLIVSNFSILFWNVRSCLNYGWVLRGPVSSPVCKQFSEYYTCLWYERYMWSLWRITGRLFRPLFWLQQQIEIENFSFQPPGFAWMWIIMVTFCNNSSERIGFLAQMSRDQTPMSEMPLNFVYSAFGCRCLCDINSPWQYYIISALMGQKCWMLRHPFFARVTLVMLDWVAYLLWW